MGDSAGGQVEPFSRPDEGGHGQVLGGWEQGEDRRPGESHRGRYHSRQQQVPHVGQVLPGCPRLGQGVLGRCGTGTDREQPLGRVGQVHGQVDPDSGDVVALTGGHAWHPDARRAGGPQGPVRQIVVVGEVVPQSAGHQGKQDVVDGHVREAAANLLDLLQRQRDDRHGLARVVRMVVEHRDRRVSARGRDVPGQVRRLWQLLSRSKLPSLGAVCRTTRAGVPTMTRRNRGAHVLDDPPGRDHFGGDPVGNLEQGPAQQRRVGPALDRRGSLVQVYWRGLGVEEDPEAAA